MRESERKTERDREKGREGENRRIGVRIQREEGEREGRESWEGHRLTDPMRHQQHPGIHLAISLASLCIALSTWPTAVRERSKHEWAVLQLTCLLLTRAPVFEGLPIRI